MAYNSVDRCQLKTGTRPFPLLHASAETKLDEAYARGSGVRVFLPRPLAFAAALRCSIGVRRALQPCGWRALVQRAPPVARVSGLVRRAAGRAYCTGTRRITLATCSSEIDLLEPRLPCPAVPCFFGPASSSSAASSSSSLAPRTLPPVLRLHRRPSLRPSAPLDPVCPPRPSLLRRRALLRRRVRFLRTLLALCFCGARLLSLRIFVPRPLAPPLLRPALAPVVVMLFALAVASLLAMAVAILALLVAPRSRCRSVISLC